MFSGDAICPLARLATNSVSLHVIYPAICLDLSNPLFEAMHLVERLVESDRIALPMVRIDAGNRLLSTQKLGSGGFLVAMIADTA